LKVLKVKIIPAHAIKSYRSTHS